MKLKFMLIMRLFQMKITLKELNDFKMRELGESWSLLSFLRDLADSTALSNLAKKLSERETNNTSKPHSQNSLLLPYQTALRTRAHPS